jgi:hypothetical protein
MFEEFTLTEKVKGLLGLIIIFGLSYYAYPYDAASLFFGAITIALIARFIWWVNMETKVNNALASIILEGEALRTEAEYKHRILNPELYDEFRMRTSFDNELYDYMNKVENEDYLIVGDTVPNNDVEIIQYGIYSKVHDIWIGVGCHTSGATGPSDKTNYWLCDEDFNIIRYVFLEHRQNVNIKKFINLKLMNYGRVDKKYLKNYKKSAKRKNYY